MRVRERNRRVKRQSPARVHVACEEEVDADRRIENARGSISCAAAMIGNANAVANSARDNARDHAQAVRRGDRARIVRQHYQVRMQFAIIRSKQAEPPHSGWYLTPPLLTLPILVLVAAWSRIVTVLGT
jgi:hypothetical protein